MRERQVMASVVTFWTDGLPRKILSSTRVRKKHHKEFISRLISKFEGVFDSFIRSIICLGVAHESVDDHIDGIFLRDLHIYRIGKRIDLVTDHISDESEIHDGLLHISDRYLFFPTRESDRGADEKSFSAWESFDYLENLTDGVFLKWCPVSWTLLDTDVKKEESIKIIDFRDGSDRRAGI